ncbi:sulfatase-like hydrolase/transferase [Chloroflexi bacterium TSY]|nr:sulfatase-like hydrolase/transferase [Chloroflexi bacterium TSY]
MASRNPNQPNIIFILSDDQGPWALGCAGNPEIRTPNLDRLAASGIRFESFFCTSPVCSPARASLLTGRIPSQHGVHDWIREGNMADEGKQSKEAIDYLAGQLAYTEILAENGYLCGFSGKWHLGDSLNPQKGFTHWYVHERGGGPYYNAPMIRDGQPVQEPGYLSDLITDDALAFIETNMETKQPFCLHVHYTAPHSPWIDNHPPEIVESYADCPFESCPQEPRHPWANALQPAHEDPIPNLQGYFASVTAMDMNIGRILDRLDESELTENTLVFFTSDNGFNCGHHGIWGKGNGTFPQNMYDTSVKVPTIISQPGRIAQDVVCDTLLSGYDFMPTLLDYLGLENPMAEQLPGRSFVPLLSSGQEPNDEQEDGATHVVVYDEYGPVRMIRSKTWKYVHRYPYGPHELYDLVEDADERTNLVDDAGYADIVKQMKGELEAWFVQYVDPARDGTHEAVTGAGQLDLAGPAGKGAPAFAQERQF